MALYVLDSVARYRGKQSEILTVLNASANHGILMHTLQKFVSFVNSPEEEGSGSNGMSQEFMDALLAFTNSLSQLPSGGTMLITAGIVPALVSIMNNQKDSQVKVKEQDCSEEVRLCVLDVNPPPPFFFSPTECQQMHFNA